MSMGRIYLYGIIDTRDEASLGVTGLDGASPVHILAVNSLGCVASNYRGPELSSLPRETVLRYLLRHQQVVEQVMRQQHTILPVKFGTTVNTPDEVRGLLAQGHQQLVGALAFIQDKVEVEVAATWDMERVLQEVAHEAAVARVRDSLAHQGQPTLEQQAQLGQMVKASLDRRRDTCRKRMVEFLGPQAIDVLSNALVSDEMVMNVAFLVERARQDEFDCAVHRLDEIFQNQITFRVIGPLPPYSFSTVEVARLTFVEIDRARRTLGLGDVASESGIRKAYRRLAAQSQRAAKSGNESASYLTTLRQASDLLLRYLRVPNQGQQGEGGHGLESRNDKDGVFTVRTKRSETREIEAARFGGLGRA